MIPHYGVDIGAHLFTASCALAAFARTLAEASDVEFSSGDECKGLIRVVAKGKQVGVLERCEPEFYRVGYAGRVPRGRGESEASFGFRRPPQLTVCLV